ncbi:MAG: sugar transferase [Fuerstiella sp.]|nr:sugar transferase [Fuerstiella sp.]MCP4783167.1 sugar transferase [Fuerstiella sp.]MCP4854395.1 sugar transferase [Fuerstiella sp.]
MAKRLFDIVASVVALLLLGPLILLAAVGIRLSSRGPAFYCPLRAGLEGQSFTLFKLRTMHLNHGANVSVVTGANDSRVFAFGSILRKLKLDELPQLWNILRGDMSIVGPRPEDLKIVAQHYDDIGLSTLAVRPGLAGVSSIYNYTHGEKMLTGPDPEQIYARDLLPIKLALEAVYLQRASVTYDLKLIMRTVAAIVRIASGQKEFPDPPEMPAACDLLDISKQTPTARHVA